MAVSYIDGNETVLTEIEGIYNAPDRFYIKGETLANPLEAYIIGNEYIVRDPRMPGSASSGQGPSAQGNGLVFRKSPCRFAAPSFCRAGRKGILLGRGVIC